jgi:hypothetical protein
VTLHDGDGNAVAALRDQGERAVALTLSAGCSDGGECQQDNGGTGGERGGHARPAARSMVLPTRDRRHGTPLPDNAFECFDRARERLS